MIYIEIALTQEVYDAMVKAAVRFHQTVEELAADELDNIYG